MKNNRPEIQAVKKSIQSDWSENRLNVFAIVAAILLSYTIYLWCSIDTVIKLGDETGPFELGTSACFLISAVYFIRSFKTTKSVFFLLLGIVFFFGAAEEISWGQQIFHFETPESIKTINVQDEFNIHNLYTFNTGDDNHVPKKGLARLLEFNFLFRLFCLFFGIALPLITFASGNTSRWIKRIKMPVPSFAMGIFFLINWIVFRITLRMVNQSVSNNMYYEASSEIFECIASFIFLLMSFSFFKQKNKLFA